MPLIDLEEGGGGVQAFTGTITDAFFNTNEYGTSLCLVSTFDNPEEFPSFENGTFTRYFPAGPKWETENGDVALHPDGPEKKFNTSTRIGQLCTALNAVEGIEGAVSKDFSPYTASSWKGLHLTWGQVPVQKRRMKKDDAGNDTGSWESYEASELLPVALGDATAGPTVTPVDLSTLGLDKDQTQALVALAQKAESDPKFLEGVIGIPGLTSNTALMGAVSSNIAGLRQALADSEPF